MRRVLISDDRGRRVRLCGAVDLGPGVDDAVRSSVDGATALRFGRLVPVITSIAVVFIVMTVRDCESGRANRASVLMRIAAQGVAVLIAGGAITAGAWVYSAWRGARLAREACLGAAVCPSCGYDLIGLVAERDGYTVCPECSGAWKPTGDHRLPRRETPDG